jgi:hypothetical protein
MKWYTLEERPIDVLELDAVSLFHTKIFMGDSRILPGQIYFDTIINQYRITIFLSRSASLDIFESDILLWIPSQELLRSLPKQYLDDYYDTTLD